MDFDQDSKTRLCVAGRVDHSAGTAYNIASVSVSRIPFDAFRIIFTGFAFVGLCGFCLEIFYRMVWCTRGCRSSASILWHVPLSIGSRVSVFSCFLVLAPSRVIAIGLATTIDVTFLSVRTLLAPTACDTLPWRSRWPLHVFCRAYGELLP